MGPDRGSGVTAVNGPKCTCVTFSVICTCGGGGGRGGKRSSGFHHNGAQRGVDVRRGAWCLSPQLGSLSGEKALLGCYLYIDR